MPVISRSNHCCGRCRITHCDPGNYSTETSSRRFDLLFGGLRCEYTLWSVNESLCCSTSVPYLDITVLIRWIKLISKTEHRRTSGDCHCGSLMIQLPSPQLVVVSLSFLFLLLDVWTFLHAGTQSCSGDLSGETLGPAGMEVCCKQPKLCICIPTS